jgi:hypothetical protein
MQAPDKPTSSSQPKGNPRELQERLHELLTRLYYTLELIKNWPESEGDDASVHMETTTKLMGRIQDILEAIKRVEGILQTDEALYKSLQACQVPLDLLGLMDHGGGLNPECFSRGLLKEALGQLAGLKRRKLALQLLGHAVQSGLQRRDAAAAAVEQQSKGTKRSRPETTEDETEPPKKRQEVDVTAVKQEK